MMSENNLTPSSASNDQISLGSRCNAEFSTDKENEVYLTFPKTDGYLSVGLNEFIDLDHLMSHIADSFGIKAEGSGLRSKFVRAGKYHKLDGNGKPCCACGDPVTDSVTDESGVMVVGGTPYTLGIEDIREPKSQHGGLLCIDMEPHIALVRETMLRDAALGRGSFTLVASNSESVSFASTNPSERVYFRDGGRMRFKAWKRRRYLVGWSMGAEIETWGGDFDTARIDSSYIDIAFSQVCAVVKNDSDSDSNDDYVDEYEWGVNAPQPRRVASYCNARWKGRSFSGSVEAGPDCFTI